MSANPYRLSREEAEGNSSASLIAVPGGHPATQQPLNNPQEIWLTDDLLFNFQRCNRRAFLDAFGDKARRDPPSDYLIKLRQDSLSHQLAVLSNQPVHQPFYPFQNWQAGAAATLELMRQGVERISRGVLVTEHTDGVYLVSCPDLLVKHPGISDFGDWIYVPTDIRLGKRPKLDYQVSAAFHAYVLAAVQGTWCETSWLVLRQRGAYSVDLIDLLPRMQDILDACVEMLRSQQEPEVFIAHNRCDLCHWYSHCYGIAQSEQHLSLLPGVTPSRYIYLRDLEITSLETLAATPPKTLESLPGFGTQVAYRLIQQALASLHNQALPKPLLPGEIPEPLLLPDELPTAPIELYFDIEAAPEQNLVYLHGILVVDRQAQTSTFHPLLAEGPEAEGIIWEDFLELVWRYPDAPIFHFCPYEVQTVKRLAEAYGTPFEHIEPILDRFVDLHERVTRVALLPVESYALKSIARWIGFDWRDPEANGAQSIYWYAQWLSTGDRTFLESILCYNEDDCRATHQVKDWLVNFVETIHRDRHQSF